MRKNISRVIILSVAGVLLLAAKPAIALDSSTAEAQVKQVITEYIYARFPQRKDSQVKIVFQYAESAFEKISRIDKPVQFNLIDLSPNFQPFGQVVMPIQANWDGGQERLFLRADIKVYDNVVIAKRKINKGEMVSAADFDVALKDITFLPRKFFAKRDSLQGLQMTANVQPQQTIYDWMVRKKPVMGKNTEISIVVNAPNVYVKSAGIALEDGEIGQLIRVKKLDDKNKLTAKVINSMEAEVEM